MHLSHRTHRPPPCPSPPPPPPPGQPVRGTVNIRGNCPGKGGVQAGGGGQNFRFAIEGAPGPAVLVVCPGYRPLSMASTRRFRAAVSREISAGRISTRPCGPLSALAGPFLDGGLPYPAIHYACKAKLKARQARARLVGPIVFAAPDSILYLPSIRAARARSDATMG